MKPLSEKHLGITSSVTLAITSKAKRMKAEGEDVVNFGSGEPDFNTPENIREAAIRQINAGKNGYTAATGLEALKKAICDKLKNENGLTYVPSQIVVSTGAKQSLYNTMQALCNPGDEVILIAPYWVSYPEQIKLAGAVPVVVHASLEDDFSPPFDKIKESITEKTKLIIINSPNNPSGTVYTEDELRKLGKIAADNDLYVISDEIYEKLVYEGRHVSLAGLSDDLYERTITINGMSKAYAMTGWRIGYSASSKSLAKIMGNLQSHATSNPNTIAQHASITGLTGEQSEINRMRDAFDDRRRFMMEKLNEIRGLAYATPAGAFYVLINITRFLGKKFGDKEIRNGTDFAETLLDEAKVAVIPGIAFGADHYIRLTYACGIDEIETGLERLHQFCKKFR